MKSIKTVNILAASLFLFIILTVLVIVDMAPVALFNHTIYHHISQTIHPTLTSISILIGGLTHWYSYAPIILILIILPYTRFRAGIPMAITLSISALTGPIILKNVFAIERPNINPLISPGGFGYPSGHSLNALVFFSLSALLIWRYAQKKSTKIIFTVFAIVAILLVGLSRIYLGVHTVTDVLGGYLAGSAILCTLLLLEDTIKEKLKILLKQQERCLNKKIIKHFIFALLGIIVLVHLTHAVTLDRMVMYREITFTSSELPPEMDGYTIAFVTDPHADTGRRLKGIVETLNQKDLDLLILGGDFTFDKNDIESTMNLLAQIQTRDGAFGVEGNHDDYQILFPAMEAHGLIPLSNSGVYLHDGFFVAGVEDLWNRNPDVAVATADANNDSFILLISHNPDVTMTQNTSHVNLTLSGHTHGGQFNIFNRISIGLDTRVISDYGTRFKGGWAQSRDGTPVYVSNGIGEYYPRVFARPEVTIITLVVAP